MYSQCKKVFQIESSSMDSQQPIKWALETEEFLYLSQKQDITEAAFYILERISVLNSLMILLLPDSINQNKFKKRPPEVMLLKIGVLKYMQRKLKQAKFISNFKKYKLYLSKISKRIIARKITTLDDQEYIVVLAVSYQDEQPKDFVILTWNLCSFSKLETTFSYQESLETQNEPAALLNMICENLFIFNEGVEQNLILNPAFIEELQQELEMQQNATKQQQPAN